LLGGSSLIYLAPGRSLWHLLVPAYAWATLVCLAGTAAVGLLRDVAPEYLGHLLALSLLQAYFSINTSLLLGRKREAAYNILTGLQVALLAGGLLLAFVGLRWWVVPVYYYAAYLAYGLPTLLSLGLLLRLPDQWHGGRGLGATARELAQHSRGAHFSNMRAFTNYRLSYYFVAHYADARAVGVLSVGVALAEAIWLIPRSTALIQYVDLVHATDKHAQIEPTLRVARLTLLTTVLAVLTLCALPPAVLTAVFGPEFGAARPVILLLAPGVAAIAVNVICSTYFAGVGRYRVNNLATTVGLLVTIPACWLLIPAFGIRGAAVATTLSYVASTGFLLRQFCQVTGARLPDFLPRRADLDYARSLLKKAV
jgi:O-antigen/teichoic acid export membrane protein